MTTDSFHIREATAADVANVARLHVATFVETHGGLGSTFEFRYGQWLEAFARADGSWFCFVVEDSNGALVGFAKGIPYTGDLPGFGGELNKIYLLREYHRRGLGRRLISRVARRFVEQGITSMLLFGDARNASNGFYEALGAERLLSASGEFHGGYGWWDLRRLADRCGFE